METNKFALFAGHTATGSIYQTIAYEAENMKHVQFWFAGPKAAGVGASATIWFEHAVQPDETWENYPAMIILGAGGGTIANASWRSSFTILSGAASSMVAGYLDPDFMPSYFRVKYELSGVAASASAGTISAWALTKRQKIS